MSEFEKRLNKLNPQQKTAVETIEGPVLVVAGPGTGKTEVLALRVANILDKTDSDPGNILTITFTEAGVTAMRKRLQQIIGKEAFYVNISTFHGFCNDVIQQNPDKFPEFSAQPNQLDDLSRVKLVNRILAELDSDRKWHLRPAHNHVQFKSDIISAIQTLKKEGVDSEELAKVAQTELKDLQDNPVMTRTGNPNQDWMRAVKAAERNIELAEIYEIYQDELDRGNFYDYEDMIMLVVDRFQTDPELLADHQERFHYILVDEYQDTNGSQNKLVELLGQDIDNRPNIFAVGDDDQAIYRFQGANVDNLLYFNKLFDDVQTIGIDINYRSNQAILDFAENSISNNQNRLTNLIPDLNKRLTAGIESAKYKPEVYRFSDGEVESRFVVEKIKELVEAGYKYEDIAVLYRRHADVDDLFDHLVREQIPAQLSSGSDALQALPVQKLIRLLEVITHVPPEHDSQTFEVLFYKFLASTFGYSRYEVFKLIKFVNNRDYQSGSNLEILDVLLDRELLEQATGVQESGLLKLGAKILEWRELSANETLAQFIAIVLAESGLIDSLFDSDIDIDEANALNSFYSYIKEYSRVNTGISLQQLLSDLRLLQENNLSVRERKLELSDNGIQLMTAHGSKGLEFKCVFIIKCNQGNWGGKSNRQIIKLPNSLLSEVELDKDEKKDLQQEDERRLFFVAATRAKERLIISSAESYSSGGKVQTKEQSQFVSEVKEDLIEVASPDKYEQVDPEVIRKGLHPIFKVNLEEREKDFLRAELTNFRLSASALNEYLECPLKFKFNRLLKMPIPTTTYLAQGNAVHYALEKLARAQMTGSQTKLAQVLSWFENSLEKQGLGAKDYQDVLTEGKHLLSKYFENYGVDEGSPAEVEYYIKSVPLEIPGMETIQLTGKIDRVEWVNEEEGIVKVRDYKTSSPKTKKSIRGEDENNKNIWRQLVFYKILTDLDPNFRPKGKMNKFKISGAEVDFIKPNSSSGKFERVEIEITDGDVESVKQEIREVMTKIRNLEFYNLENYPGCSEWELGKVITGASVLED